MNRSTLTSLALVVMLSACGQAPEWTIGETEIGQTIIGGTPSAANDYPAVGALLIKGSDPYYGEFGLMICTGTLIASEVVLLAAHCVDTETLGLPPDTDYDFYFTFALDVTDFGYTTLDLPANTTRITKAVAHPSFDVQTLETGVDGPGNYKDVAVAFLETAVTDRTAAMVMEPDDTSSLIVDANVVIVGYGIRDANYNPYGGDPDDAGIQYRADSVINEVGDYEMQIGRYSPVPQKCHGDSGGPTFLNVGDGKTPTQRLVGVTSHAYDATDCARGGVDTRVDVWRDWIQSQMVSACTASERADCANGGILAVPVAPRPPTTTTNPSGPAYYVPVEPRNDGCNAAGSVGSWVALAGLLLLRRRRC